MPLGIETKCLSCGELNFTSTIISSHNLVDKTADEAHNSDNVWD